MATILHATSLPRTVQEALKAHRFKPVSLDAQSLRAAGPARALILAVDQVVTSEHLEAAQGLAAVAVFGEDLAGNDPGQGRAACLARGLAVCDAQGAFDAGLAEYVIACAVTLSRGLWRSDRGTPDDARELFARPFAVLGLSRGGRGVAYAARGLGATVLALDPSVPATNRVWDDLERHVERRSMLRQAAVVSVHRRSDGAANDRVDQSLLAELQPHAVLIDARREGAVDLNALTQALHQGRLKGAAVDRTSPQPDDPPPNLLLTRNAARGTFDGCERAALLVARKLSAVLSREEGG